jgi:hypothetical protein
MFVIVRSPVPESTFRTDKGLTGRMNESAGVQQSLWSALLPSVRPRKRHLTARR